MCVTLVGGVNPTLKSDLLPSLHSLSWGRNFYVNGNILPLWSFVVSFKKINPALNDYKLRFVHG